MGGRRVLVVGAGIAGLLAAQRLRAAGHAVTVVDKGRGVGGRLATRRIGDARVDHGAQFFTVRSDEFRRVTDDWSTTGVSREWCRGFAGQPDGHPRYVGAEGMSGLAKAVTSGLDDVRVAIRLAAVGTGDDGRWWATTHDGVLVPDQPGGDVPLGADAVVCTPPAEQTLALLRAGGATGLLRAGGATRSLSAGGATEGGALERLRRIRYDPTLALLVVPGGATAVPDPGGVQLSTDPVWTWVADNLAKGVSPVPALTLHAGPAVSRARWEDDREATLGALRPLAAPWLASPGGESGGHTQLVAWRYAAPSVLDDDRCLVAVDGGRPLVCAGDAFGEARVEGAALSGLAAADAVLSRLA